MEYMHNVMFSLHGLELRVSHKRSLGDAFDIIIMEAAVSIKKTIA